MICNNCGKFVSDDARFCDACGMQQLNGAPPADPVSAATPLDTHEKEGAFVIESFEDAPTGPCADGAEPPRESEGGEPVPAPAARRESVPAASRNDGVPRGDAPGAPAPTAAQGENGNRYYPPGPPFFYPPYQPYGQKAMSSWQFILYFLLMAIPVVNFILIVAWSFSERVNENRRNLSRAMLAFTFLLLLAALGCLGAYALGVFPFRSVQIRLIP